ncbi:MAG: response regulator [Gallionella sp.]|jgi:two-component system chemotaxis sensor kinase CheA
MTKQNDDFQKKLLATFRIEADEHLQVMSAGLIELENKPAEGRYAQIIESVFREAHSLKGAARAVNMREIESVCQSLESVFAALKGSWLAVSPPLFPLMQEAIDELATLLMAEGEVMSAAGKSAISTLTRRLNDALQGAQSAASQFSASAAVQPMPPVRQTPVSVPSEATAATVAVVMAAPPPSPSHSSETVRVSTQKLDAVMRQVEELLSPQLAMALRASELREVAISFAIRKKQWARMRPVLRSIERYAEGACKGTGTNAVMPEFPAQELPKLLEHMESEHLFMKTIEARLLRLSKLAAHDSRILAGMNDSLLRDVKEMQLLPFSSLLEIFPRFTRELAREQGKQVELLIQGGEIEIDRHTLEEMKDPLMHLLRNCIDHGIEPPAMRQDKGKPQHGSITLAIEQKDSGKIEILVADDGTGIDVDRVREAAHKHELIYADETEPQSDQAALELVFQSGISTSRIITDISGRGLGLAIVREKVERLGGFVAVESRHDGKQDTGSAFRITLPLMRATFRGVLVRAGGQLFVLPLHNVECVLRVAQQDILTVENRTTIAHGGKAVALVSLDDVLALPRQRAIDKLSERAQVVILGTGHKQLAFLVDEILGEQEVLVKTLGRQLARVRNVAGASVLGTGQVVAVLNVPDLLKSAKSTAGKAPPSVAAETHGAVKKQSILVVEDSITSRALLKNILESAGFLVTTAVDGVDAYTALKTGSFDLIVSDVEMPRMDGFDLTAKVRADKQFTELPVVLVTALESREHRERGIDVGANAYIVKSSFDQSNLLEVVRRLI